MSHPDDAEIDLEITEIRTMNIEKSSRASYERSASKFILFLFASAIALISPIFWLAPPPLCNPTLENVRRFFAIPYEQRNIHTAPVCPEFLTAKDFMRFCVTLKKIKWRKAYRGDFEWVSFGTVPYFS